ncbi:MAG TPA: sugar-binding protein, partial [Prolixibacteraceae bacterium]|nr:sugar-binding protein [Prolixibacteraceae bacterium]
WWKMLWDDNGLYLLTFIEDDKFVPAYKGTVPGETWMYDKLEIYFDVNYDKQDGLGAGGNAGHYQVAPTVKVDLLEGGATSESRGEVWAYNVSDPEYYVEYFFPFSMLLDNMGNEVDKTEPIGFDVNIMDNDKDDLTPSRNRMNWANGGAIGENWANMNDAGLITLDGAVGLIDISSMTISGGAEITTDNGTVQLSAALEPADATQPYKWKITNGTGMATISKTGLVTAQRNGTVKVQAFSADEFVSSNELTITISGQRIAKSEISIIQNGNFENGADGKENWGGAGVVEDGFYNLACTPKVNIWDTMFGQPKLPIADATTKYIVRFKAKASEDMVVPVLMEDRSHDNNKTVTSSSPYRNESMWMVPVTTEEQWFELDVIFSSKQDDSAYELNFQAGMVSGIFSIGNIMMYSESDLALVDPSLGSATIDANSIKVYPNPVGKANILSVSVKNAKGSIAIYNSVGQKMMAKTVTGNIVRFDVSSLQKGLYFVKTSDGATQKFIR